MFFARARSRTAPPHGRGPRTARPGRQAQHRVPGRGGPGPTGPPPSGPPAERAAAERVRPRQGHRRSVGAPAGGGRRPGGSTAPGSTTGPPGGSTRRGRSSRPRSPPGDGAVLDERRAPPPHRTAGCPARPAPRSVILRRSTLRCSADPGGQPVAEGGVACRSARVSWYAPVASRAARAISGVRAAAWSRPGRAATGGTTSGRRGRSWSSGPGTTAAQWNRRRPGFRLSSAPSASQLRPIPLTVTASGWPSSSIAREPTRVVPLRINQPVDGSPSFHPRQPDPVAVALGVQGVGPADVGDPRAVGQHADHPGPPGQPPPLRKWSGRRPRPGRTPAGLPSLILITSPDGVLTCAVSEVVGWSVIGGPLSAVSRPGGGALRVGCRHTARRMECRTAPGAGLIPGFGDWPPRNYRIS